jgi:malonyl CoA-acyl carrier protein transacylase/acyl carrier protein
LTTLPLTTLPLTTLPLTTLPLTTLPWLLSGRTDAALRAQAARLHAHLAGADLAPAVVARRLALTRTQLAHRAAIVGDGPEALLAGLAALAEGRPAPDVHLGRALTGRTAWLFTGQGSQHSGMGRGLYAACAPFRDGFDAACAALGPYVDRPLRDVLWDDAAAGELDQTGWTQPAIFAVQAGLAAALGHWGLQPDAVLGHSVGEIAAAHVAGVLSLDDAARLVAARGRLMQALPPGGGMLAISASEQRADELVEGLALDLAAVNSPGSVVVSGPVADLDRAAERAAGEGLRTKRLAVSHAFHSALMEPMLADFREVVATLDLHEPALPVVSDVTGRPVGTGELTDPEYWVEHVRRTVRFADGVQALRGLGVSRFVEVGPDATLTALARATLGPPGDGGETSVVALQRAGHDEARQLAAGLGAAFTAGLDIDWARLCADVPDDPTLILPTYAFQRRRFWLDAGSAAQDAAAAGLDAIDHPLLTAAITVPDTGQTILTGMLGAGTPPWLPDHAVHGVTLLPGTGFVELALVAAGHVGAGGVDELTLEAPLVLPDAGAVAIRVVVGPPEADGRRAVSVHSRAKDADWTRHADGTLSADATTPDDATAPAWPPAAARALPVDGAYAELAAQGYHYGPQFQGMRAAWVDGADRYAEVELPEPSDAARYLLHPALLDAAMHVETLAVQELGATLIPFSWQGVTVHRPGAHAVRVRVHRDEQAGQSAITLLGADGAPVASVRSVVGRPVSQEQLTAGRRRPLYRVEWRDVPAPAEPSGWTLIGPAGSGYGFVVPAAADPEGLAREGQAPALVLLDVPVPDLPVPAALRAVTTVVLTAVQQFLAEPSFSASRLVVVTRTGPDAASAAVAGAVTGLVRSAEAENPGQFGLVDIDPADVSAAALPAAASIEFEVRVRDGRCLVPRLVAVTDHVTIATKDSTSANSTTTTDTNTINANTTNVTDNTGPTGSAPEGTALITGGTGGLGAQLARHLVTQHGVRSLLLVSRRGPAAEGAAGLVAELTEAGAHVQVAAADVADRDALAALVAGIDPAHPLTSVFHLSGVLDDGLVTTLDAARFDRVLAPKADAAWHLHELTRDLPLTEFVLFSSASGQLMGSGQANYAAANVSLDALAAARRRAGLPALSLAWGLWAEAAGMGGTLSAADLSRLELSGSAPLTTADALAMLDEALARPDDLLVPLVLNPAALRARWDALPPLLHELVPAPARQAAQQSAPVAHEADPIEERLATVAPGQRLRLILDVVREQVAAVRHDEVSAIDATMPFTEFGLDSMAAIELRNGLSSAIGMRLPATMTFDYPTPADLAGFLLEELAPQVELLTAGREDDLLRARLAELPVSRLREAGLLDTLLGLLDESAAAPAGPTPATTTPATTAAPEPEPVSALQTMSLEELLQAASRAGSSGPGGPPS